MKLVILTILAIVAFRHNEYRINPLQNSLTDCKVDSLFKSSFTSIRKTLNNNKPLSRNEAAFIYLGHYLSGISIEIESYSGIPKFKIKNLLQFEKWYNIYKHKIIWKNVKEGLQILNSNANDEVRTNQLLKLRIK